MIFKGVVSIIPTFALFETLTDCEILIYDDTLEDIEIHKVRAFEETVTKK